MARSSRRGEVRATAARIFRERGYRSATMGLLAESVGLNKGTLYHYYPSKDAILYELLSDQVDATIALLDGVPDQGPPAARMEELVRMQIERVASAQDELVVFFQELPWIDRHLPASQVANLRWRIAIYRRFILDLLKEGIKSGDFRELDTDMIQFCVVGALAYIPNWYRVRKGRTHRQLVDELTAFVMRGVSFPGSDGSAER